MNIVNAMEWYSGQRPDLPEPEDIVKIPVPVEVRHVAITPEQVCQHQHQRHFCL